MQAQEKIGPYRLIAPLGSGGMGTVWRAWDERLKRPVALKRILPATPSPTARERFRREAEAGARLNHPAIVHLYDILETEEGEWIVLEFVDGPTLQELLRQGPLDLERTLRLGREIAEGLAEAHAQGLLHRDLKASNVMVAPGGRAKILDFGVAKLLLPEAQETTLSAPGLVVGTTYAMSPEQAMGLPLDARSDLFALGSLLYEMVTGEAPFRAETASATLARVCHFRPVPLVQARPGTPPGLSDLIGRLLEKEPVDRPASAAEVAAALDRIASTIGDPRAAEEESRPRRQPDFSGQQTAFELPLSPSNGSARPLGSVPGSEVVRQRFWGRWGAIALAAFSFATVLAVYFLGSAGLPLSQHRLYQQGMTYLDRSDRKGHLHRAVDCFERVLAQDASHAAAHAGLAKAYWLRLQGDSRDPIWLDRSLAMARRAVDLDPYLASARVSLGLALGSAGRPEEALQQVQEALALEPRNADAFYAAGRIYESQGKPKDAEAAYRKSIAIRPHRLYLDELGSLYLKMGRIEDAKRVLRRSVQVAPDGFIGFRNLGVAYFMQGDLAETASLFQQALQIRPDSTLYANLGTVQFAQGFYRQSVDAFEKALELPGGANQFIVWGNLGDACRWTPERMERSREAYRQALRLLAEPLRAQPEDPTLRSHRALYLAKRGDLSLSLAELQKLERLPRKDASCWFRMAVAYEVGGRRPQALAALDQALRAGLPLDEVRKDPELLDLRAHAPYQQLIGGLPPKL